MQRDNHILAADTFDRRYRARSASAERAHKLLGETKSVVASPDNSVLFRAKLAELTSTRYVAPERPAMPPFYDLSRRSPRKGGRDSSPQGDSEADRKAPFDLYRSVWRPRIKNAASKDLYDTEETIHARFQRDWQRMLSLGAAKLITGVDDEASVDPHAEEVQAVGECLLQNYQLCCALFWYYAASKSGSLDSLSRKGFRNLCVDCGLARKKSKHCTQPDLDAIFSDLMDQRGTVSQPVTADFADVARLAITAEGLRDGSIRRAEFLLLLLRVAVAKYVLEGEMSDASDALHHFLRFDIVARIGDEKLQMPDDFRRRHAYTEPVCEELERSHGWLRRCFELGTSLNLNRGAPPRSSLILEQWLELCHLLDVVGPDLGEREAVLCFSWSRMAVIDASSMRGRHKEGSLPFEGFVEALCRAAALKVLPTDADIAQRRVRDAADCIGLMRQEYMEGVSKYDLLMSKCRVPWGCIARPPQPMARRIVHLFAIMALASRQKRIRGLDGRNLG